MQRMILVCWLSTLLLSCAPEVEERPVEIVGEWHHHGGTHASDKYSALDQIDASNFYPIKLHWSRHPDKDQKWRDLQDKLLGVREAAQECDCLWGESKIKVLDTVTGAEMFMTLEELYGKLY